jgi:hypothetical protein
LWGVVDGCEDDGWEREEFGVEFGYKGLGREGAVSKGGMRNIYYSSLYLCIGIHDRSGIYLYICTSTSEHYNWCMTPEMTNFL